jgi:MFS family permease
VEVAGFFFVIYSAATLVSRPFAGRLFDSKGANFVMYPAIVLFAIGLIVLSQAGHAYALLLAGASMGLGLGAVQSAGQTIAVKVAPAHRMGLANSTFFMFLDIAIGIGPFVIGLFVPFAGYRGLYTGMGVVAFTCMFLYYLLYGKRAARAGAMDV